MLKRLDKKGDLGLTMQQVVIIIVVITLIVLALVFLGFQKEAGEGIIDKILSMFGWN